MSLMFFNQLRPLNFFYVHGTMCCRAMYTTYDAMEFTNEFFCYQAKNGSETNVLVIFGSISQKLAHDLSSYLETMAKKRCVIHIRGCNLRVENECSSSSLAHVLPINMVFSHCQLSKKDYKTLIKEARQCLKV